MNSKSKRTNKSNFSMDKATSNCNTTWMSAVTKDFLLDFGRRTILVFNLEHVGALGVIVILELVMVLLF